MRIVLLAILLTGCTAATFPDWFSVNYLHGWHDTDGSGFVSEQNGESHSPLSFSGDGQSDFVGFEVGWNLDAFQPKGPLYDRFKHRHTR